MVNFINTVGRLGGFQQILDRIEAESTGASELSLLALYVACLGKAAPMFHKKFVLDYFEKVEVAANAKILRATTGQLRSTRKERFDEIVDGIYKTLLPRITTRDLASLDHDRTLVNLELG